VGGGYDHEAISVLHYCVVPPWQQFSTQKYLWC